jgi:hypothetical protein
LAGRIDNTKYKAAMAKAATFLLHEDDVRFRLSQILVSDEFSGSRRCQEFLFHVVDRALAGNFNEIKERMLGISLFGRDAGYDTNSDAIVRVTANDVRKRLRRYNETAPAAKVQIELPSGSYIPEFHHICRGSASIPVVVGAETGVAHSLSSQIEPQPRQDGNSLTRHSKVNVA